MKLIKLEWGLTSFIFGLFLYVIRRAELPCWRAVKRQSEKLHEGT